VSCFLFLRMVVVCCFFFFFTATAPTGIYSLSLHDALPISHDFLETGARGGEELGGRLFDVGRALIEIQFAAFEEEMRVRIESRRSEEHTSELQSRFDLVCRLLLEKKKKNKKTNQKYKHTYH